VDNTTRPRSDMTTAAVIGVVAASSFIIFCYLAALTLFGVLFQ